MKLPFIRGVLALFLWPSYAKRISRKHHEYLNSPEQMARKKSEESWADEQITLLRRSWLIALATVAIVLVTGWLGGRLMAAYITEHVSTWQVALQYTGAGLLLCVTLGQGGWSIQSMKGATYAEQLDGWARVHRVIHIVGTLLFVAGTAWSVVDTA
jgi:hypothetical protein